jgi:hypothetical protein
VVDDFGTAIFTGCAPGQGLEGIGGMQFQAHSIGVDRNTLAVIRHYLIYEPSEILIRERKPIEAFPPSFAHAYDGVFATAAGVYIGREVDGNRQGNHLTHAIVTTEPRSYRSVRPAQLFGAPFWGTEPAATTQTERLAAAFRPGPLDPASVSQFVGAQPDGVALLAALVSALMTHIERPGSRRVLIISEQADLVARWLTAATLLMPQQDALRIGFKIFTTDPARTALPVVAVHPGWTRSTATVEDDGGYVVFDLTRHRWTAVPEQPQARYWAELFCEANPYDVCEAIELAAVSDMAWEEARNLASAAVLGRTPSPEHVNQLIRWLDTGPLALREAYGGALIAALARLRDQKLLLQIERMAENQFPGRLDEICTALLHLEMQRALQGEVPQADGRRRSISAAGQADAARFVADSLRQSREGAFDAVLRVASRFDISVPLEAVRGATAAFVANWADHPTSSYDPSAWPLEPRVYDMLRDELSSRIKKEPSSATATADEWWNHLWNWTPEHADIASPLHRALLSAAMVHSNPHDRIKFVRAGLSRSQSTDHDLDYRELAAALWARTSATMQELRLLCDFVPPGTRLSERDGDGDLYRNLMGETLASATGTPASLPHLEFLKMITERGLVEFDGPTTALLVDHHWLCEFENRLGTTPPTLGEDARLLRISPNLVASHAEPLARGLLAIEDPARVARLARRLTPSVGDAYLSAILRDGWRLHKPIQVATIYFVCVDLDSPRLPDKTGEELRRRVLLAITEWRKTAPEEQIDEIAEYLAPLRAGLAASWKKNAAEITGPGFRRRPKKSDN